jgi:hypothetical protein
MAASRKGIVARGFIVAVLAPVLALLGCGSPLSSPDKLDAAAAHADGGPDSPRGDPDASDRAAVDVPHTVDTDGPAAPDRPAGDVPKTDASDGPSASDDGSGDVADGAGQDVTAVCVSPLGFPPNSQSPSMCPGVVLKNDTIPFAPTDSRWSTLYQDCLDNYGSLIYPDACRKLCTTLATTSAPLKYIQGIDWCTLDCSQPGAPVLSVRYSDTICEQMPLPDAASGSDTRADARLDGPIDTGPNTIDGGRPAQVALRNVSAYGNCMPSIAADPIIVLWTVDITGAAGASAQVSKATITVSKGTSIVQDFTVEQPTVSLVNGAGSADQRKSLASVSPNQACSSMCSGATYQLELVFDINGQRIPASKTGTFSCAY